MDRRTCPPRYAFDPTLWRRILAGDCRGGIALVFGLSTPVMLLLLGLVVDTGLWIIASTRLQMAADAAAMSAAMTMGSSGFQQQTQTAQRSTLQTLILFEAQAAANKLLGTLSTSPNIQYDPIGYSYVSVTLTTQTPSLFASFANVTAPVLSATSRAYAPPKPACVLALSTSGSAITVTGGGTVIATGCGVFSDSTGAGSITVTSGAINATTIGASGGVSLTAGATTSVIPTPNASQVQDPNQSLVPPTPGPCNGTNDYSKFLVYVFTPTTWCGDVTISNGLAATFLPGVYIIVNGNLTFDNALATISPGVTFLLTGSSPGSFGWINNLAGATALAAPLPPAQTAGIAIWAVCNKSGNQTVSFQGIGALVLAGSIYAPCAALSLRNTASVTAAIGKNVSVIAASINVSGGSTLAAANTALATGTAMLGP